VIALKRIFLTIILLFIAGCVPAKDFNYGIRQINELNSRYNTTMENYPVSMQKIDLMLDEYRELKKTQLQSGQEQFNYIVNYRTLNLEAEKLFVEGQKYGLAGTTKGGFGCKSRPLIIESVSLRNSSALKGFEAVGLLREFVGKYPEDAKLAGLSEKNVLFLNATFYQVSLDARRDSNIINHFCPKNVTLELYQQEFRKKTNMSGDFIKNMGYDEAVPIWKNLRGIN